ncbi:MULTISPECIES: hypothetical protein [unclassified Streptomyces]|nr:MULTISPECIES: hypothetical protein [unclassified Streptomyces]MDU0305490.1 hypothetical protein [Streptomyces sp. PAL114]
MLRRLGEWCARHIVVIVAWLVALVVLQLVAVPWAAPCWAWVWR